MSKSYPVIPAAKARTNVDQQRYEDMYRQSVEDNPGFWAEQARRINWIKPFSKIKDVSWDRDDVHIRWSEDGRLNACFNCVDRHLDTRGDVDWSKYTDVRVEHLAEIRRYLEEIK